MPISSRFVVRSTIGLLAIGFLALFGIVLTTIWLGHRSQVYFNEVFEARDIRSAAVELRDTVRNAESSQRGYIVTGNEIYLAPYDTARAQSLRQLDALTKRINGDSQSAPMLARLTAVINEKVGEMDQTIALKREGKDAESLTLFRTNRGKALMDEANVFLYGIILSADERLTTGVSEQRANAAMLWWVSIIGGGIIVLVVGGVVVTAARYTREIAQARDEVRLLNTSLEDRVARRTADLAQARDHAQMLVTEVNHRVANSLQLVGALVKLQSNAVSDRAAKEALAETQGRINAIASVHKRLYSSGDVRYVSLDEYLSALLEQLETSMRAEGHGASLKYELDPVQMQTDASVNLGVVVTEWVTNAFKYAYPEKPGEVRVRLKRAAQDKIELTVEDDGVGRHADTSAKGSGLGTRIVNAMATTMRADIEYLTQGPGTTARLVFAVPSAA